MPGSRVILTPKVLRDYHNEVCSSQSCKPWVSRQLPPQVPAMNLDPVVKILSGVITVVINESDIRKAARRTESSTDFFVSNIP